MPPSGNPIESYNSKSKQTIRDRLWYTAFDDILTKENVNIDDLKYFTLPGPECKDIIQIVRRFNLAKKNITAVERDYDRSVPIRLLLEGQGAVYEGNLEDLCKGGKLNSEFPFDIINLDYCGTPFQFSGEESKPKFDTTEYFIKSNAEKEKKAYYLLLTVMGARSSKAGQQYLNQEIKHLAEKYSEFDKSIKVEGEKVQIVTPNIIETQALENDYKIDSWDSYRYRQDKKSSPMVSFSFKLSKIEYKNFEMLHKNRVKNGLYDAHTKRGWEEELKALED